MEERLYVRLARFLPTVLAIFRIVFGLLLLCHATAKLFGWPVGPAVPTGVWPLWYAGVIEVVCGALITAGLLTRAAAFIASGEMAFAYFTQHISVSFWPIANRGEPAVMNCFAFLLLVFAGPGAFALDSVLGSINRRNGPLARP